MAIGRRLALCFSWMARHLLVELTVILFGLGLARGEVTAGRWPGIALAALVAAQLVVWLWMIRGRFSHRRVNLPGAEREYLQLELLLVCGTFLLFQVTGGRGSPLYPVLFLLLAVAGALADKHRDPIVLAIIAMGLEMATWLSLSAGLDIGLFAHLVFMGVFPLFGWLLFHAVGTALRRQARAKEDEERRRREEEAEYYRRVDGVLRSCANTLPIEERIERRERSSLRQLEQGLGNLLEMLYEALRPHSVAVYLLSADGRKVQLKSCWPRESPLVREAMPAKRGLIGAILNGTHPVVNNRVRENDELLTHYSSRCAVRAYAGVPILEDTNHRGVLLADKTAGVEPFGDDEKRLLVAAARELWRIIETEQLLGDMDEEKNESERFYEATDRLNRAVRLPDVVDEVLSSVRSIYAGVDFTAIALRTDEKRLILEGAQGDETFKEWIDGHLQMAFSGARHLCGLAIDKALVVPTNYRGSRDADSVFGKSMPLPPLHSLKVFPLLVAGTSGRKSNPGEEKAIGAMVVASRTADLFPDDSRRQKDRVRILQTMANTAAISIQNAQRFQQLERLATTDGLTGLHNHRRFQEMLDEAVAAASRYGRPLSLLFTDIDHFKNVNDTYGHPMGDQVLKRVARVLAELARAADRVCRYGGEEFAVILPETEGTGARILAERTREEIKKQVFQAEGKEFRVTLSLGICTLPDYARHRQELIDHADQALYHAKRSGRDRSVHYSDLDRETAMGA